MINHSAEIDYKDFVKIYRECTTKPYYFLTIDTTLPAIDPLKFRKKFFHPYKNDSICWKIVDNKIRANQAQYDLDRVAAKISAL